LQQINTYFTEFSDKQKAQLEQLLPLYSEWNEKINVISRKDMEQFHIHHVLHSLSISTIFQFTPGTEILDLGCGGGFPGIPLAIFFPETKFLMVDSVGKKLKVVEAVASAIGLDNVKTRHTRVEDIKDKKFDCVVSRAVAPLKDLWRWSRPVLRKLKNSPEDMPNGLVCLKGGDLHQEIQESGCKPYVWEIEKIFSEAHFKDKFILYQPL
jgi:16S rRNA (guanine527-N7)-methyltransferase